MHDDHLVLVVGVERVERDHGQLVHLVVGGAGVARGSERDLDRLRGAGAGEALATGPLAADVEGGLALVAHPTALSKLQEPPSFLPPL